MHLSLFQKIKSPAKEISCFLKSQKEKDTEWKNK
jgi:hypothetical protein